MQELKHHATDTGRDQWITVTEYSPEMDPQMDKCSIIDNGKVNITQQGEDRHIWNFISN